MTVQHLRDIPPWEWPKSAATVIKEKLRDRRGKAGDRMTAVELAGTNVVVDDEMAELLAAIVRSREEPEQLRARAAISLGPVLEEAEMDGFDDDDPFCEPAIRKATFDAIQDALRSVFDDQSEGKEARRRALEGSVRARQDWHTNAVRQAYSSPDPEWKLTAVFAMGYVPGFDKEIVAALESKDQLVRFEAVRAAGSREVEGAWPHIRRVLQTERKDKDLLIAAIEASASVNPEEAGLILVDLADSPDKDIAEAAEEAMMDADTFGAEDDEE